MRDWNEELHAIVIGRVQNVGFRYFVVEKARHLDIQGYTRNLADGTVEVLAQGPRATLEHLLLLLWQGPPAAQVYQIQTTWQQPTIPSSSFHIRY